MRFVLAAGFGGVAYWLFPSGIFSAPLSQVTIGQIICLVISAFCGLVAVRALFEAPN